jgi:hypothetical protein
MCIGFQRRIENFSGFLCKEFGGINLVCKYLANGYLGAASPMVGFCEKKPNGMSEKPM